MTRITRDHVLSTGATIFYHAEDVRKERTGVHAKVIITIDKKLLAWTSFNVERDEDRTRLANSASKALGSVDQEVWSSYEMKHGLDLFCAFLWEQSIGQIEIGPMAGERRMEGPTYLCKPFVMEGGGTIIYAPPGRGKSFTALLMTASMDAGVSSLFACDTHRKGLYINIERDRFSMSDRLARINDCLGLPEDRPLHFMNQRGKSLGDIIGAAQKYVDANGIEFVLLDSISRAGLGDLNENQPVNRTIDALNGLCRSWCALAHTPRSDESHLYGSVHFEAGMDVGVKLTTQAKDEGLTVGVALTVTKANDGRVGGKPLMYALEFDDAGLTNVRTSGSGEFLELEAGGIKPPRDEQNRKCLLSFGWLTASEITEHTGIKGNEISTICGIAPWAVRERRGKQVFWSVQEVGR